MINAFKQVRLTNINLSGANGRIEAGASGSFAYLSELEASGLNLSTTISNNFNTLSGDIASTGINLYDLVTGVSGSLAGSTANSIFALSSDLATASGALDTKINEVSGSLNTYIDDRISGVIDMAPAALDTLNELAAALGDDENFASNLTNTLTNISGSLDSGIASTGSALQSQIDTINSTYVTLGTTQTISGNKDFTGDVTFDGGFEVGSSVGTAALFVSGSFVGINTEAPTEALDVNGSARVEGTLFVASGIDSNNSIISNVAAPVSDGDATNKAYVTGISGSLQDSIGETNNTLSLASGFLQSGIDTKVASASQKQFSLLIPTGIETSGISFPGDAFSSTPSVQLTVEGEVGYQAVVRDRTTSGFTVYFSDVVLEENTYLNVFASNQ